MSEVNVTPKTGSPQGEPTNPIAYALSKGWTLESAGEDWGERANVYCPAQGPHKRKLIAVSIPLEIATFIVDSVNMRIPGYAND